MSCRILFASLAVVGVVSLCSPVALAQPVEAAAEPAEPAAAVASVAATGEVAKPTFYLWQDDRFDGRIKPVLQIAAPFVVYIPSHPNNPDLATRATTLLLSRFGFEGQLFGYLTFRSVFERNIGFRISRNGPVGTGVWEGTASLSARENFLRLERAGFALTAGILLEPASVDYGSENILDTFGMDPYVRDPALLSGANQGQGVLLQYSPKPLPGLTAGLGFTGGNPLTSTLSYGFGGQVGSLGTLYTGPLRALSNGFPGSNMHMNVFSPTLAYERGLIGIRAAAQLYMVDVDVTSSDDTRLSGYNLRATGQLTLLDGMVRIFAGGAFRRNQQLASGSLTELLDEDYKGLVLSGGADFRYRRYGFGGSYYRVASNSSSDVTVKNRYLNIGATYWFSHPHLAASLRWGRSNAHATNSDTEFVDTNSLILGLRMSL